MEEKTPLAWVLDFFYNLKDGVFEESEKSVKHRIWQMTGLPYDKIENIEQCGICEYTAEPGIGAIHVCRQAKFTFRGRQFLLEFTTNSLTVLMDPLEETEGEEV